jgi:Xaa-Pro aminopeptidase
MTGLPPEEFHSRVKKLREIMDEEKVDIFLIYGDEYRRENLRYVSNYWPIFERGMLAVAIESDPVLLVAPECQHYAREMSVWKDIRMIHEMEMAYVPEHVGFSSDTVFSTLNQIFLDMLKGRKPRRIRVCGVDAMSVLTYDAIKSASPEAEIINSDQILYKMRLIKSQAEIEMLKRAWEICDIGYKAILDADLIGLTEIQAAAIGEKAARDAGTEHIVFSIFASGERTNSVIGRPNEKIIFDGEMIMSSLAIQYHGYIASNAWPFVAGKKYSMKQRKLIEHLIKAESIAVKNIRNGAVAGEVVGKIKEYFKANGLEKYDLYPPIHGNGLAEAESPYPDEHSTYAFETGMGVNMDVSLFGIPGVGSNRIEEGFIVSDDGVIVLSKLINRLREEFLADLNG